MSDGTLAAKERFRVLVKASTMTARDDLDVLFVAVDVQAGALALAWLVPSPVFVERARQDSLKRYIFAASMKPASEDQWSRRDLGRRLMSDSVRIPVERLRQACTLLLLDHLAQNENGVIDLGRDYFWTIDDDNLYNLYIEPAELGVGQISESWAHLEALLDGTDEAPTRHLVWLAELLRAVGTPETRKPLP